MNPPDKQKTSSRQREEVCVCRIDAPLPDAGARMCPVLLAVAVIAAKRKGAGHEAGRITEIDFRFRILDFGFWTNPKSKIENPKSVTSRPLSRANLCSEISYPRNPVFQRMRTWLIAAALFAAV
ncbi:MAG TPA: hypothetical protein VFM36_14775, partial [Thermoanaerobaculia bacterium]|nr:hypothetical protein [Thermoanaerobaculia bacterium]